MPQIIAPPESQPQTEPITTTCPHCHYTISYTADEIERVSNNAVGILCPQCGGVIETKHIEPFTFPETFYHYGEGKDSVHLTDKEVQSYVDVIKRKLQQELKVGDYTFTSTGDIMVFGFKFEDEDRIIVVKNYWEESIFHED